MASLGHTKIAGSNSRAHAAGVAQDDVRWDEQGFDDLIRRLAEETRNRSPRRIGSEDNLGLCVDELLAKSYAFRRQERLLRGKLVHLEERSTRDKNVIQELKRQLADTEKLNWWLQRSLTAAQSLIAAHGIDDDQDTEPDLSRVQLLLPLSVPPTKPDPVALKTESSPRDRTTESRQHRRRRTRLQRFKTIVYSVILSSAVAAGLGAALEVGMVKEWGMFVAWRVAPSLCLYRAFACFCISQRACSHSTPNPLPNSRSTGPVTCSTGSAAASAPTAAKPVSPVPPLDRAVPSC